MNYGKRQEGNMDAFARLRISEPYSVIDANHTRDINVPQFVAKLTGTGSQALNANSPYVSLSVTTNGDRVIRQTRHRGIYQSGKSLLVLCTGSLNPNGSDYIVLVGKCFAGGAGENVVSSMSWKELY